MKALVTRDYGPVANFGLEEVPVPQPGAQDIQVRVAAASLNPADLLMTSGAVREAVSLTFPYTLGTDFAGTVTGVGEAVTDYAVGDEVFGFGAPEAFAVGGDCEAAVNAQRVDRFGVGQHRHQLLDARPVVEVAHAPEHLDLPRRGERVVSGEAGEHPVRALEVLAPTKFPATCDNPPDLVVQLYCTPILRIVRQALQPSSAPAKVISLNRQYAEAVEL